MKLYKLIVYNKNFSNEEIIVNPKDFPNLKKGDIVEIYHPEDEFSRLLLQITSFKEDLPGKETINVEQSIANTFQLRTYGDVYMNVVNSESVALDSVELTFKDQYLGRSEMWRLKNSLVNTCVYLNKKIEFLGGSVRCQVYEMWALGDRVACGVITENTKVVFRSSTSMVYLFLQMSSEMWDFDIHGDLYFEKAVNSFMADLFNKWKKHGSNHEVTIVLFSRTFYHCSNIDEFPLAGRECLQIDYKGRFYEDFYRVVVQNERYDDWSHVLVQLRKLFTEYQHTVLEYHNQFDSDWPKPVNSTAAQGNFLEVLNMSLNVFEKHYLERSFDRTGQLAVVITPGVGVFEVDRELTNVTKQRIIDNGVGCDVVCVGEQPLHAVPLLKFQNRELANLAEAYSMPHWINLSFYSTNKKVAYSTFIPRIKLPPRVAKCHSNSLATCPRIKSLYEDEENALFHAPIDYDAYDSQVFALSSVHTSSLNRLSRLIKKTSVSLLESGSSKVPKRKMSDPDIHHESSNSLLPASGSSAISIPVRSEDDFLLQTNPSVLHINDNIKNRPSDSIYEGDSMNLSRVVVGSMGSPSNQIHQSNTFGSSVPLRPGRALINPFDPSHVTIKLTSNRRRWSHIFPKGPTGLLIQQHHYQAGPANDSTVKNGSATASSPPSNDNSVSTSKITRSASQVGLQEHIRMRSRPSVLTLSGSFSSHHQINRKSTLLWGATGEQEWTPALTTVSKIIIGVDWKSLTIPACLPITTDYFPDEVCLKTDYVFSDYSLLPDGVNADFAQQRAIYRKPLSTQEVFRELVSQRLAQGFQLILETNTSQTPGALAPGSACLVGSRQQVVQPNLEYKLSIGRVFHHIVLNGSEIGVTRYRPKHPYPPFNVHYHYRFQAPDHDTYEVSWVSFNTEKLENYNWNYLDHYICTRGDTDFALAETLKYWRFRFYILPLSSVATKKILEGSEHCDLYTALTLDEQNRFAEIFLRYIEIWVNKIKRPNVHKKGRLELSSLNMTSQLTRRRHSTGIMFSPNSQTNVVGNSPFRERLGSNRLPDKPRPRSGSKVMERGRASPATDVVGPLTGTIDNEHTDVVDDFIGDALVLKESASNQEIIEAMKHPVHGVGFFSPQTSLPSNAFVSSDAVAWLKSHMDGISTQEQATVILENLRKGRLICHASGEFSHPLIVGFCLYHIVAQEKGADYQAPLGDLKSFEDEWLEVEVRPSQPVPSVPSFLADKLPPDWKGCSYKHTHLEIDAQGKSDRVEWGHARYQSVYQPDRAFEMAVQWMAASGSITADLITVWARKAQTSGLLMIPIPPDPFALPYSQKSDPLRGPVFIPLDVECLMGTRSYLFEDFSEDTWAQRLMHLQEAIAIRFGFIACSLEAGSQYLHYQYIHLSGNVFLMIPSVPCKEPTSRGRSASTQSVQQRYPTYSEVDGNPHQQYIIKQQEGSDTRVGFLWSWNHMTSRRWKWSATSAKSEEAFQNKLLSDFCHFCSNGDNRLKAFWDVSCTKGNS